MCFLNSLWKSLKTHKTVNEGGKKKEVKKYGSHIFKCISKYRLIYRSGVVNFEIPEKKKSYYSKDFILPENTVSRDFRLIYKACEIRINWPRFAKQIENNLFSYF